MSDDRQQVGVDVSRPAEPDSAAPEKAAVKQVDSLAPTAFRVYSIAVLLAGVLAAGALWWWLPFDYQPALLWGAPLLAIGFLLAERLAVNVDVRGDVSWTISFTELPMAVGLLVAPFHVVLVAHVVAGVATLMVRRVSGRVLYNAGVMLLEATSAFALAHVVNALTGGNPAWLGAFAGAMAVPLSSTLLAVVAVRLLGRRMRLSSVGRLVWRVLVVGLLNASLGVAGYEVVVHSPWGWPLIVLVCVGVLALYFAYTGLLREQRDLEALADASLIVARSGQRAAQPDGRHRSVRLAAAQRGLAGHRGADQGPGRRPPGGVTAVAGPR